MSFCDGLFQRVWMMGMFAVSLSLPQPSCTAQSVNALGNQFISFKHFRDWAASKGQNNGESFLISPEIVSKIAADEVILSWNADVPTNCFMVFEVRAVYPGRPSKWYNMGRWSTGEGHPRESVLKQKDQQGDVKTDTLVLERPADHFQVRVTLGRGRFDSPKLKFLAIALTDSKFTQAPLAPNKHAWGRLVDVPERSQMPYPNGNVICSPTTVSMMMSYWSTRLSRRDLENDVPDVVKAVYDTNWKGTGNWAFNMAYPGSFRGMRAYVTRMSDVSELEDWIAAGMPVGLSLCYDLLRGRISRSSGHLVVCVGFTVDGDPIINDPGTSQNVRKVFKRKNLINAWAYSRNAAYIIYPEDATVPKDRFGHWESWTSRQRTSTETARFAK